MAGADQRPGEGGGRHRDPLNYSHRQATARSASDLGGAAHEIADGARVLDAAVSTREPPDATVPDAQWGWLRDKARGSERLGQVASSNAQRRKQIGRTIRVFGLRPTSHPPGDRERAIAILGDSLEEAREYSMKVVQADALALKLDLEASAPASPLGGP